MAGWEFVTRRLPEPSYATQLWTTVDFLFDRTTILLRFPKHYTPPQILQSPGLLAPRTIRILGLMFSSLFCISALILHDHYTLSFLGATCLHLHFDIFLSFLTACKRAGNRRFLFTFHKPASFRSIAFFTHAKKNRGIEEHSTVALHWTGVSTFTLSTLIYFYQHDDYFSFSCSNRWFCFFAFSLWISRSMTNGWMDWELERKYHKLI